MTITYYRTPDGEVLTFEQPDPPQAPLEPVAVAATLNAVLGVWSLEDAANAVNLTPADLIHEAEAWAVAAGGER